MSYFEDVCTLVKRSLRGETLRFFKFMEEKKRGYEMSRGFKAIQVIVVCSLLLFLFVPIQSQQVAERADNQIIVKLKPGIQSTDIDAIQRSLNASVIRHFRLIGAELWKISGVTVEDAIARYASDPRIEYIEPDYIVHALEVIPNDPSFNLLWGLHNTGQSGGTPDADIDAPEAWEIATGDDVVLGVIDTGVDWSHADLSSNIWTNPGEIPDNGVDDDGNGYIDDVRGWDFVNNDNNPTDDNGHGTHVSGTIAAAGNNGIGVAGVSWSAKIMPLKFLDAGGGGYTSGAILAVEYATMMGARFTNNSWGGGAFSQALRDAIEAAGNAGMLFIAAAGNSADDNDLVPHYPSSYDLDNIIAVAATDHNDALADFSCYGATSVDLAAPGVNIYSCLPGGSYGYNSGTSMATPQVSGAVSLFWSQYPSTPHLNVRDRMFASVDILPALVGSMVTGGRLNVFKMMAEPDVTPPAAVSDLATTDPASNAITLTWTATGDDGASGTASSYDIRYSLSPIDDGNFGSANEVAGEPHPQAVGSPETFTVPGLDFSTTYYFAVKAFDEWGNPSPVSNSPSGTTLGMPHIVVSPDALSEDLLTGATSTQNLTIENTEANTTLDFCISIEAAEEVATRVDVIGGESVRNAKAIKGRPLSGKELETLRASFPQQVTVPSAGSVDKGAPSQKVASKVGALERIDGEEVFGSAQNQFRAGPRSRGNIFACTSSTTLLEHRFYMNPSVSTQLWFLVYEGESQVGTYSLVSASDVTPAGPGEAWYSSGDINVPLDEGKYYLIFASFEQESYYYNEQAISPYPIPASFGALVGAAGWDWAPTSNFPPDPVQSVPSEAFGEPVAYYQTIVTGVGTSWLSVAPECGTVPGASSMNVEVTFDAAGLDGGDYFANISVASNDSNNPEVIVPATLHVTGAPDIAVVPAAIDYGPVFIGGTKLDTLVISNEGTDLLSLTELVLDNADFSADLTPFDLAPRESRNLFVTCAPTVVGSTEGALTITSTDPDEGTIVVDLQGTGVLPPEMVCPPSDTLSKYLFTGETRDTVITLCNDGETELSYCIRFEETAVPGSTGLAARAGSAPKRYQLGGVPGASTLGLQSKSADREPHVLQASETMGNLRGLTFASGKKAEESTASVIFEDGFEDGDFADWVDTGAGGMKEVTSATAAKGVYSFRQYDSPGGHMTGVYHDFGAIQPGYISFYIRSGSTSTNTAYFVLRDSQGNDVIWFFAYDDGLLYVNDDVGGDHTYPYAANTWYHIQFKDIDFVSKTFDYYVNETFVKADIPFRNANVVNDFYRLDIYNYDYGSQAWWDEVEVSTDEPAHWVHSVPVCGTVAPNSCSDITVTFDATDMYGGDYYADLVITGDDPLIPECRVPTHLHVTGAPDIAVWPPIIDYGQVFIGATKLDSVVISNSGTDVLHVSEVTVGNASFSTDLTPFELAPEESRSLVIAFAPPDPQLIQGTLTITSDDPDESPAYVELRGIGVPPPLVVCPPSDTLSKDLFTGGTAEEVIQLCNEGESDLVFCIAVEEVGESSPGGAAARAGRAAKGTQSAGAQGTSALALQTKPVHPEPHALKESETAGDRLTFTTGKKAQESTSAVIVADGFEDGNYDGWLDAGGSGTKEVTSATAAKGVYSYHEYNSSLGHFDGIYQEFGAIQPGYISFYIRSGSTSQADAYFVLHDSQGYEAIWFYADESGSLYANDYYSPYVALQWYHIEFKEIDFVSKTFDYYVDGNLVATGISFRNPYDVNDFYRLDLYNFHAGAQAWWDEIRMATEESAQWLRVDPVCGTVPPGGSCVDINVTFDAADMYGGDYDANLVITSNDPFVPECRVPAHLHVTGVPDIAVVPLSIDYGPVFIGATRLDSLVISNEGTDVLHVTEMALDNTDFSADLAPFELAPEESRSLVIAFAPGAAGLIEGTLMITSDDIDEGAIEVDLSGEGVLPPEMVCPPPDTLSRDLFTGGTWDTVLTLCNEGESDLTFSIRGEETTGPAKMSVAEAIASIVRRSGVLRGEVTVKSARAISPGEPVERVYRSAGEVANVRLGRAAGPAVALVAADMGEFVQDVQNKLLATGTVGSVALIDAGVVTPTLAELQAFDAVMVWSDAMYEDNVTLGNNMADYVDGGGGVVSVLFETAFDAVPNPWNLSGRWESEQYYLVQRSAYQMDYPATLGSVAEPGHPIMAGVSSFDGGSYSFRPTTAALTNGSTLIASWSDGIPLVVVKEIALGKRVDLGFFPVSSDALPGLWQVGTDGDHLLANALAWVATGVRWLSAEPSQGTVAPNSCADITVTLTAADLFGGDYYGDLVIAGDDPLNPECRVPAHLHVTGAPDIAVVPMGIDYGQTYIGATKVETLVISNEGTDDLYVSGLELSNSNFSTDLTPFMIGPHAEPRELVVAFTPSAVEAIQGTLTMTTNDPDEGTVVVPLQGEGVLPPEMVCPPSNTLSRDLFTGGTWDTVLTLCNEGESDLTFSITSEETTGPVKMSVAQSIASIVERSGVLRGAVTVKSARASSPGEPVERVYRSAGEVANVRLGPAAGPSVLLLGADSEPWVQDVQDKLLATGMIGSVAFADPGAVTPTLAELQAFDAVMVWSDWGYADDVTLGNNMADYVDGGGGVVSAMFELCFGLGGRWESEQYYLVMRGNQRQNPATLGVVTDPGHPIMAGVSSFDGGSSSYRPDAATLTSGSTLIASWSDGMPLVVVKEMATSRRVDLGFFPISSDVRSDLWQVGTDGDHLMANALVWVAGGVRWLSAEPSQGTIAANSCADITVTFDATDMNGGDYFADLVITGNDPSNPECRVPAHLSVQAEGAGTVLLAGCSNGWYLKSWSVDTPVDSTSVLLKGITNCLDVALGFDEGGLSYYPGIPPQYNTLTTMDHLHGYWFRMSCDDTLMLEGTPVSAQTPIPLAAGWNMASYLPAQADSTVHALSGIMNNVSVALGFDCGGLSYYPSIPPEFNTLQIMVPGSGYWIKTGTACTLIYPETVVYEPPVAATAMLRGGEGYRSGGDSKVIPTREWINVWGDGVRIDGALLSMGTTVKAVDGDGVVCGQCAVRAAGDFGLMAIYRDDPETEVDEGAEAGEMVTLYIGDVKVPGGIRWMEMGDLVSFNEAFVLADGNVETLPVQYALLQNYPNPFNPTTSIRYELPKDSYVELVIYNVQGQAVRELVNGWQKAQRYVIAWDGKNEQGNSVASGIYFYRIKAGEFVNTKKMVLLR
jgi:subtilisin family serine protease